MGKKKIKFDFQGYITMAYLLIVVIGMMFDYQYYDLFEINIFEYSDILDFLLAPVKNLELIAFALASLFLVWIYIKIDVIWKKKRPKSYKRFNFGADKYREVFYVFAIISYLFLGSTLYAKRQLSKFNSSPKSIELMFESGDKKLIGNLIGKNSDYIFLQTADSTIKAIPILTDVQEIIISKPK